MDFYPGLCNPQHAQFLPRCFISANVLRRRKGPFKANSWIMDSGAFTEITKFGCYRHPIEEYAALVRKWSAIPGFQIAVAQDYMCEPFVIAITGLSVDQHQHMTVERYSALRLMVDSPVMPVLQGYAVSDYVRHIHLYGTLLEHGAWVGVGSICKRNSGNPGQVTAILSAIKTVRPDLRLHGFGLKSTALADAATFDMLHSSDSMAWSFAARYEHRDAHDWREAEKFSNAINTQHRQTCLNC